MKCYIAYTVVSSVIHFWTSSEHAEPLHDWNEGCREDSIVHQQGATLGFRTAVSVCWYWWPRTSIGFTQQIHWPVWNHHQNPYALGDDSSVFPREIIETQLVQERKQRDSPFYNDQMKSAKCNRTSKMSIAPAFCSFCKRRGQIQDRCSEKYPLLKPNHFPNRGDDTKKQVLVSETAIEASTSQDD